MKINSQCKVNNQRLNRWVRLCFFCFSIGFGWLFTITPSSAFAINVSADNPNSGELIIYRNDKNSRFKSMYFQVFIEGEKLGKLKNKKAYRQKLTPGLYRITANDSDAKTIQVTIKSGDVHIIKAEVYKKRRYGMRFIRVDEEQFVSDFAQ